MTVMSRRVELVDAAKAGDLERVEKLVYHGHPVDEKDKTGNTALAWASSHGHTQIARILIEAGSDVNCKNSCKATPLLTAADNRQAGCVELLLRSGADIDACSVRGDTALHMAAFRGSLDILRQLTNAGANAHLRNSANLTAAQEATVQQNSDCVKHLRQYMKQKGSRKFNSLPPTTSTETSVIANRELASWPCDTSLNNLSISSLPISLSFCSSNSVPPSYAEASNPSFPQPYSLTSGEQVPAPPLPPRLSAPVPRADESVGKGRVQRCSSHVDDNSMMSILPPTSPSSFSANSFRWGRPNQDNYTSKIVSGTTSFESVTMLKPNIPVESDVHQSCSDAHNENARNGQSGHVARIPTEQSSLSLELGTTPQSFASSSIDERPNCEPGTQNLMPAVMVASNSGAQSRLPLRTQLLLQSGAQIGHISFPSSQISMGQEDANYNSQNLSENIALTHTGVQRSNNLSALSTSAELQAGVQHNNNLSALNTSAKLLAGVQHSNNLSALSPSTELLAGLQHSNNLSALNTSAELLAEVQHSNNLSALNTSAELQHILQNQARLSSSQNNISAASSAGQDLTGFTDHLQRTLEETREKLRRTETELADMRCKQGETEMTNFRLQQSLLLSERDNSALKTEVLQLRSLMQGFSERFSSAQTLTESGSVTNRLRQLPSDPQLWARGADNS